MAQQRLTVSHQISSIARWGTLPKPRQRDVDGALSPVAPLPLHQDGTLEGAFGDGAVARLLEAVKATERKARAEALSPAGAKALVARLGYLGRKLRELGRPKDADRVLGIMAKIQASPTVEPQDPDDEGGEDIF